MGIIYILTGKPLRTNINRIIYMDSVRTAQSTHSGLVVKRCIEK